MRTGIPAFLLQSDKPDISVLKIKKSNFSFLDRTLKAVASILGTMHLHSKTDVKENLFFKINSQIKVFSFIFLIVAISFAKNIPAQLLASLFIVVFFIISRISFNHIFKKIFFLSFVFGLLIFIPAAFNVITPGRIVLKLFTFQRSYHFWIYSIPQTIGITDTGIKIVELLFLRVLNSISLAMLFVFSSSFAQILKGLKVFFIPDTFLMILSLAYKYIFILSKTIEETYLALKSRLIGSVQSKSIRKIIAGRVFFIFQKSKSNYELTYAAMISRGYNGKITLPYREQIKRNDILFLLITTIAGFLILFI